MEAGSKSCCLASKMAFHKEEDFGRRVTLQGVTEKVYNVSTNLPSQINTTGAFLNTHPGELDM